jgi:hypothetical protein
MARGSPRRGPDGRCRSADAELWRPCWLDVAKGEQGGVGSLALLPAATSSLRAGPSRDKSESGSPNHLTKIDHANN